MQFLYGGIEPLLRIVLVGTLSYLSLLIIIHLTGQRPLGRMQTFDVIVAVAIGSTFGRLLTAQEVQFTEALTAFILLAVLHFVVSTLRYRFQWGSVIITEPVLLYSEGQYLRPMMERLRISDAEILAAVRRYGLGSLDDVEAIVLEADGTFSVLRKDPASDFSSLGSLRPIRRRS